MKINELFYSIQGEGFHTGSAAVFVRFSGCNLKCPFCDTDFHEYTEMSEDEVVNAVVKADINNCRFVVLTGGEPTMQLTDTFIDLLHQKGFYIAVESNGAFKDGNDFEIDWLTISPKQPFVKGIPFAARQADEVKLVVTHETANSGIMAYYEDEITADHYYLQPCDTKDADENKRLIDAAVWLIKDNPKWKLSLQTQKIINVR